MSTIARRLAKLEARQASSAPVPEAFRLCFVAPGRAVIGSVVITGEGTPRRLCRGDTDEELTEEEWDALFEPHLAGHTTTTAPAQPEVVG